MNFAVIFLCLLFGAVIGYEFGCYSVRKRVREMLDRLTKELNAMAEEKRKKKELTNNGQGN